MTHMNHLSRIQLAASSLGGGTLALLVLHHAVLNGAPILLTILLMGGLTLGVPVAVAYRRRGNEALIQLADELRGLWWLSFLLWAVALHQTLGFWR